MNIFVDENIPLMTVRALRKQGHNVLDIRGTDDVLWQRVQRERRVLITTNKGFTQYRDQPHHGILIVRLRKPNRVKIHQRVMQGISQFKAEKWPGMILVMRDTIQSIWRTGKKK
jgi:predicted nuclease of predicted toxin-antitoxin system